MRVLILGRDGQVGTQLRRCYPQAVAPGRSDLEMTDFAAVRAAIRAAAPEVIFNAVAYNLTEKAESEPEAAHALNAQLPGVVAEEAARLHALPVHYSTDYVFDGAKGAPYVESDAPAPLNTYARSKLAGEAAVAEVGGRYLIFRTAWVFSPHRTNFAKSIVQAAAVQETLQVVADQSGSPTAAEVIADVSTQAVLRFTPELSGIYHLVGPQVLSRYEYACRLIEAAREAGLPVKCREVLPTQTPADPVIRRPERVELSTQKLQSTFGVSLPGLDESIARLMQQLTAAGAHA